MDHLKSQDVFPTSKWAKHPASYVSLPEGTHVFILGVSLNGGTPKTPQNDHFLGKPMVVGETHHCRKHPYPT